MPSQAEEYHLIVACHVIWRRVFTLLPCDLDERFGFYLPPHCDLAIIQVQTYCTIQSAAQDHTMETYFLMAVWADSVIPFPQNSEDKWILKEKLGENVSLRDERDWLRAQKTSEAWATFTCRNKADDSEAIMKIRM
jgi:hypothetical protein